MQQVLALVVSESAARIIAHMPLLGRVLSPVAHGSGWQRVEGIKRCGVIALDIYPRRGPPTLETNKTDQLTHLAD